MIRIIESINVDEFNIVHIKEKIISTVNGVEKISFHRTSVAPGDDYDQLAEEVKQTCFEIHTTDVVENYLKRINEFSISQQTIEGD
jgi:hypothetical protein